MKASFLDELFWVDCTNYKTPNLISLFQEGRLETLLRTISNKDIAIRVLVFNKCARTNSTRIKVTRQREDIREEWQFIVIVYYPRLVQKKDLMLF